MSTYRTHLHIDLVNDSIYNKRKIDNNIKFKKWYYISKEVLNFLVENIEIETYSNNTIWFSELLGITRQSVRNKTISRKFLFLQEGYYNKDNFIKYLIKKI